MPHRRRGLLGRECVTRIIIADDHPLFCEALEVALMRVSPDAEVSRTVSLGDTMEKMTQQQPDVVFLDLLMPDSHGFGGLIRLRQQWPSVPVFMVSASEQPSVIARARHFGAAGFIPKSAGLSELKAALAAALHGEESWPEGLETQEQETAALNGEGDMVRRLASLTPAQMRVLSGLTDGLLNKQIAYEMNISEATVKAHVTAVFRKLNVINRTQAVIAAKVLEVDPPSIEEQATRN